MSNRYILVFFILSLSTCATKKAADKKNETPTASHQQPSDANDEGYLWKRILVHHDRMVMTPNGRSPRMFLAFSLDSLAMRKLLEKTVKQEEWLKGNHNLTIEFPRPDSGFTAFSVYETSTMDSALSAKYPDIKTYGGQGVKDYSESVRFDFNNNGFNAYMSGSNGEWFIEPAGKGITHQLLLCFYKSDIADSTRQPFELPDSLRLH